MEKGIGQVPPDVEAAIKAAAALPNRAEATLILASIANRATAALHQTARTEANNRKGTPEWGRWAALANVSRDAVLRTATCRQTANQLYQSNRSNPETTPDSDSSDTTTT